MDIKIKMNFKQILVIICVITIIIGGLYYLMSPYQNCLRTVEIKIEEVRNKLATETDVNRRVELESEQEGFFNQREFGCMERTNW